MFSFCLSCYHPCYSRKYTKPEAMKHLSFYLTDVKDLASKLVNEIEESDKKIVYLKHVQRQLRVS